MPYISRYILHIVAIDGGVPPLSSTLSLTVQIEDVNDNSPEWVGHQLTPFFGYDITKAEDLALGSVVIDIDATDADIDFNAMLTFTITSGNTAGHFRLDPDSGILTTLSQLDRETIASYELILEVTDGANSATCTVSIEVSDINEHFPVYDDQDRTVHITENSATGTELVIITATDDDLNHIIVIGKSHLCYFSKMLKLIRYNNIGTILSHCTKDEAFTKFSAKLISSKN